jgi:hypothetical protein
MPKGIKGFQKGHRHSIETRIKIGLANSKQIKFICNYCKKESSDRPSHYKRKKRHFCSMRCYANYRIEFMKPDEQPTWKGGITKETQRGRGNKKYKMWQQMVFERDGFACIICKSKQQIEAHHIKSWAKHIKLRYNVDNGETRCIEHHDRSKKNENPELLKEPR